MTNANTAHSVTIHTSQANASAEAMEQAQRGEKTRAIVARFKAPARAAFLNIPAGAWHNLTINGVPDNYRVILEAVLDSAAKKIISNILSTYDVWPGTLDAMLFTESNMLDSATGSDWMTKEEIEAAWRDSATRRKWVTSPNYASNAAFRKAVSHYEALIVKLAGKTSSYTPADLDLMLAKMEPADLSTELGSFAARRIDAIKNRPNRQEVVNVDLL